MGRKRRSAPISLSRAALFAALALATAVVDAGTAQIEEHAQIGSPQVPSIQTISLDGDSYNAELAGILELERILQREPAFGFSQATATDVTFLLNDGSSQESVTYVFRPAQGLTIDDYSFTLQSSDTAVLDPATDITFVRTSEVVENATYYNITYTLDFNRLPGKTVFSVSADTLSQRPKAQNFTSQPVNYTAAGLAVLDQSGNAVSGLDSPGLTIDYADVLNKSAGASVPGVSQFQVFIQYLDGTTSADGLAAVPNINDLQATLTGNNGLVTYDENSCSFTNATYTSTGIKYQNGCNMGLTTSVDSSVSEWPGLVFGVEPNDYYVGSMSINLAWDNFSPDQSFSTSIPITLTGTPPPVVFDVSGPTLLLPEGGQQLVFTFINAGLTEAAADRQLVLYPGTAEEIVVRPDPGSFQNLGDRQSVTFTMPETNGTSIPWIFSSNGVTAIDQSAFTISYARLPEIGGISPQTGAVEGGGTVQLTGTFEGFDPTDGHTVVFSNYRLPESSITSYSESSIEFTLPPQTEVGSANFFDVQVQIGTSLSNGIQFYYKVPPALSLAVTGDVVNTGENRYTVANEGSVGIVTRVDGNNLNVTYAWTVSPVSQGAAPIQDSLGVDLTDPSLSITATQIPTVGDLYDVTVTVTNLIGEKDTKTIRIERGQPDYRGVGIRVDSAVSRSRGEPTQPLQVAITIELVNVNGTSRDTTFVWSYGGTTYTVTSNTVDREVTSTGPSRLGQEFYIVQSDLPFGPAVAIVDVTVSLTNDPTVSGSTTIPVTILPGRIVAVINNGQGSFRLSPSQNVEMTGINSRDLDILSGDGIPTNDGFVYSWTSCRKSLDQAFATSENCVDLIRANQDSATFTLLGSALDSAKLDIEENTYFEISLQVSKPDRSSSTASTVLILEPAALNITRVDGIEMTSGGAPVDPNAVNYLEPLVISPIAPAGASWQFRFLEPPQAFSFVANSANLFEDAAVYYSAAGGSQNKPLGILGQKLSSNTEYVLQLRSVSAAGFSDSNDATLTFRTVQKPTLTFEKFNVTTGDTQTRFTFAASSSVASSLLQFYFYSVNRATGERTCLGPCNGAPTVTFVIKTTGTYQIFAELVDANNQGVYDAVENVNLLTIADDTASGADQLSQDIENAFAESDDSTLLASINALTDSVVVGARQVNESIVPIIQTSIEHVNRLSRNAIPNVAFGESLVRTAAKLAGLDYRYLGTSDYVLLLLQIVNFAITRSPSSNNLGIMLPQALRFYNHSYPTALSLGSSGSSRRRLLEDGQVNVVLLQLTETSRENVGAVATNRQVCGFAQSYSTGEVQDAVVDTTQPTSVLPMEYRVVILCNPDQIDIPIQGKFSSLKIECQDVLTSTHTVVLHETSNFVRESGLTDTAVDGDGLTQAFTLVGSPALGTGDQCYTVTQRAADGEANNATCFRLAPQASITENCESSACYEEISTNINTSWTDVDFRMSTNELGLFGCRDALRSVPETESPAPTNAPRNLSAGQITGLSIGILIFIILAILVAWLVATRCFAIIVPPPPTDTFEYVERDIYGRGFVIEQSAFNESQASMSMGDMGDNVDGEYEETGIDLGE